MINSDFVILVLASLYAATETPLSSGGQPRDLEPDGAKSRPVRQG
jgi:hypothetical protein